MNALRSLVGQVDLLFRKRIWRYPAHEFEEKYGLSGISRDYSAPDGHDLEQIIWDSMELSMRAERSSVYFQRQNLVTAFRKMASGTFNTDTPIKDLQTTAQMLLDFNPELQSVRFNIDESAELYDFIMGVGSGFNPHDIDFFLNDWPDITGDKREQYHQQIKNYMSEIGADHIGFIPSPHTLEFILTQFAHQVDPQHDFNWELGV